MKKALVIIGIVLGVLIVLFVAMALMGTIGLQEIKDYELPSIDLSRIPDGTYDGKCTISRWAMNVKVIVKDHKITGAELVKSEFAPSEGQSAIYGSVGQRIVEKQSVQIDAVSGASATTKAFAIAVADALQKAVK